MYPLSNYRFFRDFVVIVACFFALISLNVPSKQLFYFCQKCCLRIVQGLCPRKYPEKYKKNGLMGVKFAGITSAENLQKIGLQHFLTDPLMVCHTCDGPSQESIMTMYVFQNFLCQVTRNGPPRRTGDEDSSCQNPKPDPTNRRMLKVLKCFNFPPLHSNRFFS